MFAYYYTNAKFYENIYIDAKKNLKYIFIYPILYMILVFILNFIPVTEFKLNNKGE
ncbi:hypothetical protein FACS189459_1730 [Bacilli bacterium]|nr:hypothetical protein FACS189459_1730 [Bacilli bacterium]